MHFCLFLSTVKKSQLVPTKAVVWKHLPLVEENQNDCIKPATVYLRLLSTRSSKVQHWNRSATATSNDSGYQTDDGSKMLTLDNRSKPTNIRMTALKDYSPCCSGELALRRGQRVKVLDKKNDWVYVVTKHGEAGYVPYNFLRPSRKYAGYQSESEYAKETLHQSGYDTDMPVSDTGSRESQNSYQCGHSSPCSSPPSVRVQCKQRFPKLARQRNSAQNPVLMEKEEIQKVGSKLIAVMDYTATQTDELDIQFAETVYADVLKQAGAERIWTYCPRTEKCGFVPMSLLVSQVV